MGSGESDSEISEKLRKRTIEGMRHKRRVADGAGRVPR